MATNNKKITKAQRFEDIKSLLNGETPTYGTTVETAIEVLTHEQEILANKNNRKPKLDENGNLIMTEAQKQNEVYKGYILDELGKLDEESTGMTCKELLYAIPALYNAQYSSQKVAALLRQMGDKVTSKKVKGETRFTLV